MNNNNNKDEDIDQNIIEDLLCRFIINLPKEEQTTDRLFFHIQAAHWFYSDFYVGNTEIMNAGCKVPQCNFKGFAKVIYKHCPFLKPYYEGFEIFFNRFSQYMSQIPVYGAIILNTTLDKVLLVTNYRNTMYSFPKGKINQNETGLECGIREVWEETGIDISKYISEKDFIEFKTGGNQTQKMYVVCGVDENVHRKTNTRCEIGRIEWVELSQMDGKSSSIFKRIAPFIRPLKLWIRDYMSARSKEKSVNIISESEPETNGETTVQLSVSLPKQEPENRENKENKETKGRPLSAFEIRLEELGREFENKLIELEEVEEKKEEPNPFLSFKLDHNSLKEAFLLSN